MVNLFSRAALVKKPFDIVELFENKISALIASVAFVPFIAMQMAQHVSMGSQVAVLDLIQPFSASAFPDQIAAQGFEPTQLFIPLAIVAFLVVWLASHAINVLIVLCPFGFIDALLKLFKTALLSLVFLSYLINPYFGAAISLVILLMAAFVAAWAFRLTVFGTLLACDIIAPTNASRSARPADAHAFLARKTSGVPARTYGYLTRPADGTVRFTYRPWLIMSRRDLTLPEGTKALSKGVFFPTLLHCPIDGNSFSTLVIFLPRYRTHAHAIATHFDIPDVREGSVHRGFKAARTWFADTLSLGKAKYAEYRDAM